MLERIDSFRLFVSNTPPKFGRLRSYLTILVVVLVIAFGDGRGRCRSGGLHGGGREEMGFAGDKVLVMVRKGW